MKTIGLFALLVAFPSCTCSAQLQRRDYWPSIDQRACTDGFCAPPGAASPHTFSVGGRDTDGAVITSIGDSKPLAVGKSIVPIDSLQPAKVEGIRSRAKFRAELIKAATKACENCDIDANQLAVIKVATLRPRILAATESFVVEKASAEGLALPLSSDGDIAVGAIDWAAFADFIVKIAPIIFQFLQFFL